MGPKMEKASERSSTESEKSTWFIWIVQGSDWSSWRVEGSVVGFEVEMGTGAGRVDGPAAKLFLDNNQIE